jgi:hypothetical protein
MKASTQRKRRTIEGRILDRRTRLHAAALCAHHVTGVTTMCTTNGSVEFICDSVETDKMLSDGEKRRTVEA